MTEIDTNVSLKGVTRSARVAHHAANLGAFVRSGASNAPSARLKPSTNFGATIRVRPTANEHPPLCLDPLFRRFKGDSKAARIKDTRKRGNGPRIDTPLRLKAAKPPKMQTELGY